MIHIMEMYYETDRLILRILSENSAPQVLDFFEKNKAIFESFEPERPKNFYTLEYQSALLKCEFDLIVKMGTLRFWIFTKEQPQQIIGTVSFQNIIRSVYQSCQIGYKFDPLYWKQGYATEGITKAISIIFQEFHLHRIDALVLPNNKPSIRLLERLGFQAEGLCRSCIFLNNHWTDHLRYSLIQD